MNKQALKEKPRHVLNENVERKVVMVVVLVKGERKGEKCVRRRVCVSLAKTSVLITHRGHLSLFIYLLRFYSMLPDCELAKRKPMHHRSKWTLVYFRFNVLMKLRKSCGDFYFLLRRILQWQKFGITLHALTCQDIVPF